MYPFDIEIIYGIQRYIWHNHKKKGSIVHFLFFINAEAICYFRLRKEMFKGCQTKRLSYSSPADSRYACITDSLGFIINHAFSLSCASVKKQEEKQPAYYKLECYMNNSIYKKENPQNSILINCLIQIFSFLILCWINITGLFLIHITNIPFPPWWSVIFGLRTLQMCLWL